MPTSPSSITSSPTSICLATMSDTDWRRTCVGVAVVVLPAGDLSQERQDLGRPDQAPRVRRQNPIHFVSLSSRRRSRSSGRACRAPVREPERPCWRFRRNAAERSWSASRQRLLQDHLPPVAPCARALRDRTLSRPYADDRRSRAPIARSMSARRRNSPGATVRSAASPGRRAPARQPDRGSRYTRWTALTNSSGYGGSSANGSRPPAMTLLIDTAVVPAPQRVEFWSQASFDIYHPVQIRTDAQERFSARMWGEDLVSMSLFRIATAPNTMSRTPKTIAAGDPECLHLKIMLRGRIHAAQEASLRRPDARRHDGSTTPRSRRSSVPTRPSRRSCCGCRRRSSAHTRRRWLR